MPPTLQTARLALRDRLGEGSARAWKDNELDKWLIAGTRDLAQKTEVLQTTLDIDVTAGTREVLAPVDLIRAYRVEWNNDGDSQQIPLEYRDFNNADVVWWTSQTTAEGTPQMFTLWGVVPTLKIVLYPTPSVAGTLRVFYYRLPADPRTQVDDDDDPVPMDNVALDLPEGWEDACYLYAEYMALRRDRDPRWQEAKSLYDEQVGILFDLSRRLTDQPGQTVGSGMAAVDSWLWSND